MLIQSIKLFWKNAFKFQGRTTRAEFLYALLFIMICSSVVELIAWCGFVEFIDRAPGIALCLSYGLRIVWNTVICFPAITILVRRCHDFGKTGWWLFWQVYLSVSVISISGVIGLEASKPLLRLFWVAMAVCFFANYLYVLLSVMFTDSQKGKNEFGDSKKYPKKTDRELPREIRDEKVAPVGLIASVDTKFCSFCRNKISKSSVFCSHCGNKQPNP